MQSVSTRDKRVSSTTRDERVGLELRYEDLTQHAHVKLTTLPLVLGRACFQQLWARHPLAVIRKQGVATLLSRLVIEAEPVPLSLSAPLSGEGSIELAHERAADGGVSALFLNAQAQVFGVASRRHLAVAGAARELVPVGRVFGEHVFTKPFGPLHERKVLCFDVPGQPAVPSGVHARTSVAQTARLPERARPLDAEFLPDDMPWTFGLAHTDQNQHVNSLVYPRLFEEAALRRLARHAHGGALWARKIEINYRKPSFAGETLHCLLQSFVRDGQPGAIGYLAPQGVPLERAHCSFALQFRSIPS